MKKNLLISSLIASALAFTGCGEGESNSSSSESSLPNVSGMLPTGSNKSMVKNKPYTMEEGNTIVKKSDAPEILLDVDQQTGVTTATLISGEAEII